MAWSCRLLSLAGRFGYPPGKEMYFWPAVRDRLESGSPLADDATGQAQDAKQVLASMDKLGPGDGEFEQLLGKFIMDTREHIDFEESQAWPLMHTARPAEASAELGNKTAEGKKTAPTRLPCAGPKHPRHAQLGR